MTGHRMAFPGTGADAAAPAEAAERAWHLPPGLRLHLRDLGGRTAVFNEETADTHLVMPLAAGVLAHLQRGPASAGELLRAAGEEAGAEAGALAALLGELRHLGLIEPADPWSGS